MKKIVLLIGLLGLVLGAKADTGKEYLEKITANYEGLKAFELDLSYSLYKGHEGTEVVDSYQSVLRKNGVLSHRRLYDDEIVTTGEMSLVLNHALKTIRILPAFESSIIDQDIEKNLADCRDIQVKEKEDGLTLTLFFKAISSVPYTRIDIEVDDQFWVDQMTIYYATQFNYSQNYFDADPALPRLEINYGHLKKNWKDKEGLTDLSNYLIREGEAFRPATGYEQYEIITE